MSICAETTDSRSLFAQEMAFGPEQLQTVADAFERAWRTVEANFSPGAAREEARGKLANIALALAREGMCDAANLAARATDLMRPGKR